MGKDNPNYVVYIIECKDKSLYCGITTDIVRRVKEHNAGTGSKFTRGRRPVILKGKSGYISHSRALKLERQIKKLPKNKKIEEVKKWEIIDKLSKE